MFEAFNNGIGHGAADVGLLLLRVTAGAFFAISGFHKLFVPERHRSLRNTLIRDKVPLVRFNEWFVPLVEFVAGLLLIVGLFASASAVLLAVICFVATCVDGWRKAYSYNPINKLDLIDDFLYLPEVIYLVVLGTVALVGPGRYAVSHLLFG